MLGQLRISRVSYWVLLVIAVAAVATGFNATVSRLPWPLALVGVLIAFAFTFKPPLSFGLAVSGVALVVLLAWIIRLPHWADVVVPSRCLGWMALDVHRPPDQAKIAPRLTGARASGAGATDVGQGAAWSGLSSRASAVGTDAVCASVERGRSHEQRRGRKWVG